MTQPPDTQKKQVKDFLQIPWLGLRPDLKLHPGPFDPDGQRSWVLEDPVRGNNFRLGYTEGEFLLCLTMEKDPDEAAIRLYKGTNLRPSVEEMAAFIQMLQNEFLAILPKDEAIKKESATAAKTPSFFGKLVQGSIFFRVPVMKPDRFLTRTLPFVSWLWAFPLRIFYLLCAVLGLLLVFQKIELYFATVNYLFTPQGSAVFMLCLAALKIGHEFAHAYAAKALGLHVRTMGIFFIVFWPLLYTDTTDAWKIPNRRRRMWISGAGVLFEGVVAGISLMLWYLIPDGILRSLMFFLSGTSLVSTVFVNLNPFMRFDGYYLLMDYWGIDNLKTRSFSMLRYTLRKMCFGWKSPAPEIHPHRRGMVVYGVLAMLYRLLIGFSIAMSVYYLFIPELGIVMLLMVLWLFVVKPIVKEINMVLKNRRLIGSWFKTGVTLIGIIVFFGMFCIPLPYFQKLPCLVLNKETIPVHAPDKGRIETSLPENGRDVKAGELITRISSDWLEFEARKLGFDLAQIKASIKGVRSGGKEGAYRKWLMAEEERLSAALEKTDQAIAQLEIRAPENGRIMDVNQDLYKGAFITKGTWLFTISNPLDFEARAFVHENLAGKITESDIAVAKVRFLDPDLPKLKARFKEKSFFPVYYLPNESLLDVAGGEILSVPDTMGNRPRDAHFMYTFDIEKPKDFLLQLPYGMPSGIIVKTHAQSLIMIGIDRIWKHLTQKGVF